MYPKVTAEEMLDHFARLKGLTDAKRAQGHGRRAARSRPTSAPCASRSSAASRAACASASASPRRCSAIPKLIIVDEPTAGLDPEERVRFHNLLADIGAGRDRDPLDAHRRRRARTCARASPSSARARCCSTGEPRERRGAARGPHLAARGGARRSSPAVQASLPVISTRLQTRPHGACAPTPRRARAPGFEPVAPDLEDVYFSAVAGHLAPPARDTQAA